MTPPRVSVVIDNYNYGRFLGEAVESVLVQDFPEEVECVVVDDGSTDDSRRVIASFGGRVRAVLQENQGQATAFNAGFKAARGEFVYLLDSDDTWSPDKLKKTVPLFKNPRTAFVQHFLQDVDVAKAPLPRLFPSWPSHYALDDLLDRRALWTATSGLGFRKSVLDQILPLPKDIFYYLDDLLCAKALLLGWAANVPEVLGFHRIHEANFCAEGYWNPKKLELDFRMRDIFHREVDPLIKERGLNWTPRYREEEELEIMRRRILLHAQSGRRGEAFAEWRRMAAKFGRTRLGFFRMATCLLSVGSPGLYQALYRFYGRHAALVRLRTRLFPH